MSDEAENERADLCHHGDVSCQGEKNHIENPKSVIIFIEIVGDALDFHHSIKYRPESQRQCQQNVSCPQLTSEVFVEILEVFLQAEDHKAAD